MCPNFFCFKQVDLSDVTYSIPSAAVKRHTSSSINSANSRSSSSVSVDRFDVGLTSSTFGAFGVGAGGCSKSERSE